MTRIQPRRGTAAAWASANPTLSVGEEGYETDTGRRKIGDGATAWTSLPYNQSAIGHTIATAADAAAVRTAIGVAIGGGDLTATAVKTSAYTAGVSELIPVDCSAGAVPIALPSAPADNARVVVKKIDSTPIAATITAGGADVFNAAGGATTLTLALQFQAVQLQYKASGGIWYVVSTDVPLGGMDRRYGSGDVFNWKASNTRRMQRSFGKALYGSGRAEHVFHGDSETAQSLGAGTDFTAMWPRRIRTLLNTRGMPLGGTGWVQAANGTSGSPTIVTTDPRWVFSGTGSWTNNSGLLLSQASGNIATFTSDLPGTTVQVAYTGGSGAFTVSIDGAAAVTVTPAATPAVGTYTVNGLANTTHTVASTTTTTSNTFLIAAQVRGASGLVIHNLALNGQQAVNASNASLGVSSRGYVASQLVPDPDVVHIALGVNDIPQGKTPAQVVGYLTTIAGWYPNSDIIFYGQYQPSSVTDANWATYIQALYQMAVTLDRPLVDLYQRSGGYTNANAVGMMGDVTHPNGAGQADWGLLVSNLLARAI